MDHHLFVYNYNLPIHVNVHNVHFFTILSADIGNFKITRASFNYK